MAPLAAGRQAFKANARSGEALFCSFVYRVIKVQGCGVVFALPIIVSFARVGFLFFLPIADWVCCCSVIKGKGLGLCVADGAVIFCIASHKFGQY